MSPPLFPCPKKFTFWDTTLLPRGTFWVRVRAGPLADAPRPFSSCSPAAPRRKMRDRDFRRFPCLAKNVFRFCFRRGPFYGHSACSRRAGGKTAFGVRGWTGEDLNQNVPLRQLSRVPEGELLRTGDYGSLTSSAIRRRTGDCPPANQLQGNE